MVEHRQRIHRRWTPEADAQLRALIEAGKFLPAIAIEMGRTQEACRTRANILGISVRSSAQRIARTPTKPLLADMPVPAIRLENICATEEP